VLSDCSYRGVEWFYIDGVFGISKADIAKGVNIDCGKGTHQTWGNTPHQHKTSAIWGNPHLRPGTNPTTEAAKSLHNNLKENIDENTVNGHKEVKESGESSKLASATALLNHPAAVWPNKLPDWLLSNVRREISLTLSHQYRFTRLELSKKGDLTTPQNT